MAKKAAVPEKRIEVPRGNYKEVVIRIVGMGPKGLLCHAMTEETKIKMHQERLDKMAGATKGKEKAILRTVDDDFRDACYHLPEIDGKPRYGFPANAFRLAAKQAAATTKMFKTDALLTFLPLEEMVELKFGMVQARVDKVGGAFGKPSTSVIRAEFLDWSCDLPIEYDADFVPIEAILNLLQRAGRIIGVGAWRPAKEGQHGRFKIGNE